MSALLFSESRSREAQAWLTAQPAGSLAASWWVHTEFCSAIALRIRRRDLDETTGQRLHRAWRAMIPSFLMYLSERRHFEAAAAMVLPPESRLRGGGALHLAIASDHGCGLATLDRALHDAAAKLGAGVSGLPGMA